MFSSRKLATGAVALSLALVLGGCSAGGSTTDTSSDKKADGITVVIAEYSKDHTKAFWDAFKATYEKNTGYKMDLQIISWTDLDQASSTMVQTGNVPDILNENAYAQYAAQDLLWSADDVLPAETKADIIPAFVDGGTYKGKFYGMPDLSSARALFYNKDLFSQAGISAPPTTWDEFLADAHKVEDLGGGNIGYAQTLGPEEAQAELGMWIINNGGDFKTDGKWSLNSPENIETLEFMKDMSVKEKVTEVNPGHTNRDAGTFPLFQQGKAGMIIGFGPLAKALDTDFKDVNYGVAPMPVGPSAQGAPPQTYGVSDYLMAFKKPGNQDPVKEFYKLYYQPEQVNPWIKSEGFLPVTTSGLAEFADVPADKVYLDTLPNIHLAPTSDPQWTSVELTIKEKIGLAVAPDGDPKKFLDDLQAQAEAGK